MLEQNMADASIDRLILTMIQSMRKKVLMR